MTRKSGVVFILIFLFLLALFLRTWHLGVNGLSEDEARKILATRSYRQGDFTANGEHPMLLKLLATGTILFSEKWNGYFPSLLISPEAALRFPAALAGSISVIAIFLLGWELFGQPVALIAAALWAVDINSVALSRIAKEDPLITLFFLLGNYFLLRGKRFHFSDSARAEKSYIACGASFGALFASKYMIPYPWVALIYYDLFRFRQQPRWRISRSTLVKLYACSVLTFILLNPMILSPATWLYGWNYFTFKHAVHNGYLMMGKIYLNGAGYTLWGVPFYFFPLWILVKSPLFLLIAFSAGLIYTCVRIREDHFLFLGLYFLVWILLLSLPGGKFMRHAITLLPAVLLMQAVGIYLVFITTRSLLQKRNAASVLIHVVLAVLLLGTVGWELVLNRQYFPNQSFYVSRLAGGESSHGYYFPQDEFYDVGLREAIRYVCRSAPPNGSVLGTTPAVFAYYQKTYARPDLEFMSMAGDKIAFGYNYRPYVLAQPNYRRYIENDYILTFVHSQLKPLFVSKVLGLSSVEVYRLSPEAAYARSRYWTARNWPGLLAPLVRDD